MAKENMDTKAKKNTAPKKKTTNAQAKSAAKKGTKSAASKTAVKTVKEESVKKVEYERQIAEVQEELASAKRKEAKATKDAELFRLRFNAMLVVIAILVVIIIGFICWNFVEV